MALFKKADNSSDQPSYKELRKATKAKEKEAEKSGETLEVKQSKNIKAEFEECKQIHKERKKLRKELKREGIKKYSEFDMFADEVELSYPKNSIAEALAKTRAKMSTAWATFKANFSVMKALILVALILGVILLIAYISEERGRFTINVTADMLTQGFQISESPDFDDDKTRLYAQEIKNSNATSIYQINRGVNDVDGSHNGPGYMAYTFYLRNNGTETTDYAYTVNILSETQNTGAAAWVMFFEDGKQIVYAREQYEGKPEELYGYPDAPFIEQAYDPDKQYYADEYGAGIVTTPFLDATTALQGFVTDFEPGEVKKYTIVTWLEGDDPDCNNSILGGHVGFNVQFERVGGDPDTFFKGIYREEFDKSYMVEEVPDIDNGDAGDNKYGD